MLFVYACLNRCCWCAALHTHTSRHWLRLLRESVCLPVSQSIESSSTKVLFFLARAGARTFPRQHLNRLCQLITFWTGTWRGTTHESARVSSFNSKRSPTSRDEANVLKLCFAINLFIFGSFPVKNPFLGARDLKSLRSGCSWVRFGGNEHCAKGLRVGGLHLSESCFFRCGLLFQKR